MRYQMKEKSKIGMMLAIVFLSGYLNIEEVLSLMLYDISVAFPEVSTFTVQKIPANMYLIQAVVTLGVGWLASKMSKRKMIIVFQGGTILGAMIGFFFGTSFAMIYFSLFVLSVSCAITSTTARSIVAETFTADDVPKMISVSQISNTLGQALLQVIGGYLIARSWRMGYLTFLLGFLSLFSALLFLPEGPKEVRVKDEVTGEKPKIWTKYLIHDIILTCLFLCINSTYGTNISFLVVERNFGNAVAAGWLSSVKTGAMFLAAAILALTSKVTKKYILAVSAGLILAGYGFVAVAQDIIFVVIGAAIAGFGMGTFTPAVFMHLAKHVVPGTNAASHAFLSASGTLGIYLYPYLITLPSLLIADNCTSRFIIAILWLITVIVFEVLFQRKEAEY